MQSKLQTALANPTELVVRTMVAEDVAAIGSNISVGERNLNGVFFQTEITPREAKRRLARQVLLECLHEDQGYQLQSLEYGQSNRGAIVYATIESIRPLGHEDVEYVEHKMQQRLEDSDLALVIQFDRSTLVEANGEMLIEWTHYGDRLENREEVQRLKQAILAETRKLPDVIPLNVHFHVGEGAWRALVENRRPTCGQARGRCTSASPGGRNERTSPGNQLLAPQRCRCHAGRVRGIREFHS